MRHSVAVPDGGRQSLLDEKKLQMLGISLKRHEHRNQGVKGAEAAVFCWLSSCLEGDPEHQMRHPEMRFRGAAHRMCQRPDLS